MGAEALISRFDFGSTDSKPKFCFAVNILLSPIIFIFFNRNWSRNKEKCGARALKLNKFGSATLVKSTAIPISFGIHRITKTFHTDNHVSDPRVIIGLSVAEPEPPILGRLRTRSQLFGQSESRAGAAFLRRLQIQLIGRRKKKELANKEFCYLYNIFAHSFYAGFPLLVGSAKPKKLEKIVSGTYYKISCQLLLGNTIFFCL